MKKKQFCATVATDFAELKRLSVAVDEFLRGHSLPSEPVYRVELALEEMVTNVIKYGYDTPGRHEVKITLEVTPDSLELMIEDWGHEFNPLLVPVPDLKEDIAVRQVGGVGIHLTRGMVGSMTYLRSADRNILSIKVNLDS